MSEWAIWGPALLIAGIITAGGVTIHAVLWKRDSRAVISWVGLAWLAPFLGSLAYFLFGINRIQRRADALKDLPRRRRRRRSPELTPDDLNNFVNLTKDHPNLLGMARAGRKISGMPLTPDNQIIPLVNGDEAFPEMLNAINRASSSITLASYIFDSDKIGNTFLDALAKAKERHVTIRVLIDDVGARYSSENMVEKLKKAGITAASFLPTRFPRLPQYANLRNHRKILVVDGHIGFTGGTNIRQSHCITENPAFPTQCLHFKITGPVVRQLQRVFTSDWAFATGETLSEPIWFPEITRTGSVWARGIQDGPDEHFEKLTDMITVALASATERVRIVTPYFLPNHALIQALNVAALRNVKVEIYLPSTNNIKVVHWAATAQLWQLLEKGCQIFYTSDPFDHSKLMLVDNIWSLIGSTNWDPRSLRLNFEFNMECYDDSLADTLNYIIDQKAETAHEVTLEEMNNRSLPRRLRDGLARLLTPYL